MSVTQQVLTAMGIHTAPIQADPRSGEAGPKGLVVSQPLSNRITGKTLSYDAICDELLMSPPGETQGALARRLGYSQSWLSRIIASDAFQTRLAARIEKDIEPERREAFKLKFAGIEDQARGILLASLQRVAERIQDPAGVPDQLLVKSAEMTAKLLGYGARKEGTTVHVEMHTHLEQLAQNVRKLNKAPSATIEGTCTEVNAGPPAGI